MSDETPTTFRTSASIAKIAPALVKAQAGFKHAAMDGTAITPKFTYKYATLPEVIDSVKAHLNEQGIGIVQGCGHGGGDNTVAVSTTLLHESGEWIHTAASIGFAVMAETKQGELYTKAGPQEMGSAITYLRRYTLAAICGIASEEDDDGHAAQGNRPPAEPKRSYADIKAEFDKKVARDAKGVYAYLKTLKTSEEASVKLAMQHWDKFRKGYKAWKVKEAAKAKPTMGFTPAVAEKLTPHLKDGQTLAMLDEYIDAMVTDEIPRDVIEETIAKYNDEDVASFMLAFEASPWGKPVEPKGE